MNPSLWCNEQTRKIVGENVEIEISAKTPLAYQYYRASEASNFLNRFGWEYIEPSMEEDLEEYNEEEFERYVRALTKKLRNFMKLAGMVSKTGEFEQYVPVEGLENRKGELYISTEAKISDPMQFISALEKTCDSLEVFEDELFCDIGENTIHITFPPDIPIDEYLARCTDIEV